MSIAICRLTLRAHWLFPLVLGDAISTLEEAQRVIKDLNVHIPGADTITLLYFLSGTNAAIISESPSSCAP